VFCCAAIRGDAEKPSPQAIYIRAHYTKYDYRIPMRDGVKLFTSVYIPKDRTQAYPILLERTPYSIEPYGIDNYPRELGPSDLLAKEGFVFAYQDVRGRYLSEGAFIEIPPHKPQLKGPTDTDESTDTTTPSTGWSGMFPITTAESGSGAFPTTAFSRRLV
jgi:hypothetical protein